MLALRSCETQQGLLSLSVLPCPRACSLPEERMSTAVETVLSSKARKWWS